MEVRDRREEETDEKGRTGEIGGTKGTGKEEDEMRKGEMKQIKHE